MQEKDKIGKILEDYNDVFADIYNTLVFHKEYLAEENLRDGPTESIYKAASGRLAGQQRDILKCYMENCLSIVSLGTENQVTIDAAMTVRIMGYDYSEYRRMLQQKQPIRPVITIVLNFSDRRWNKPKSLFGMMNIPAELKKYVQNYKIKVYDIAFLEDEVIDRFTSDFRIIARFFKDKRLNRNTTLYDDRTPIRHVEEVLQFISIFSRDKRYEQAYTEKIKEKIAKGEEIYMCYIADEIEKKGIERGRKEGMEKGMEKGMKKGMEKGLSALVASLKPFMTDFQQLYQAVIKNEIYQNVTQAQVKKYY